MTETVEPWPVEQLEAVRNCPICGSAQREIIHEGLTDVTFFTAKGAWNLWRCNDCGSGYLDPRPNEASIGEAYGSYYTHDTSKPPTGQHGWRRRLGNGYRNWRFGTELKPSSRLGVVAARLVPALRQSIDIAYRFLPNPRPGAPRRLLDFGCGDGSFLRLARTAHWDCQGVEPDPVSRMVASSDGIDVRATLDEIAGERFDAVTLSHVIEHVHEPVELLRNLARRMEPGAHLYIDTPNMNAVGHWRYGRHWRGLEAPRHLVLFNQDSMSRALEEAGFAGILLRECPGALEFTQLQSRRIAAGGDPYDSDAPVGGPAPDAYAFREAELGARAEFLRVTAVRA